MLTKYNQPKIVIDKTIDLSRSDQEGVADTNNAKRAKKNIIIVNETSPVKANPNDIPR